MNLETNPIVIAVARVVLALYERDGEALRDELEAAALAFDDFDDVVAVLLPLSSLLPPEVIGHARTVVRRSLRSDG